VSFTPQQRAQFVSLLTDMILSRRQVRHLEHVRAAAARVDARARRGEVMRGQSPVRPPRHEQGARQRIDGVTA
jgi:hypothetical protein